MTVGETWDDRMVRQVMGRISSCETWDDRGVNPGCLSGWTNTWDESQSLDRLDKKPDLCMGARGGLGGCTHTPNFAKSRQCPSRTTPAPVLNFEMDSPRASPPCYAEDMMLHREFWHRDDGWEIDLTHDGETVHAITRLPAGSINLLTPYRYNEIRGLLVGNGYRLYEEEKIEL